MSPYRPNPEHLAAGDASHSRRLALPAPGLERFRLESPEEAFPRGELGRFADRLARFGLGTAAKQLLVSTVLALRRLRHG
jgi:hypothetical protein